MGKYYGLPEGDLLRRRRRTKGERKVAVYLPKTLSGEKNSEVGFVFGITLQAVEYWAAFNSPYHHMVKYPWCV